MSNRRSLIAAAVMAVAGTLAPLGAQAQTVLKAVDTHPAGYPTVVAVEMLGKKLETATSGRIKLQMFPGAVLGQEKEAVEQFGSSDSGASLGDILGAALKEKAKND